MFRPGVMKMITMICCTSAENGKKLMFLFLHNYVKKLIWNQTFYAFVMQTCILIGRLHLTLYTGASPPRRRYHPQFSRPKQWDNFSRGTNIWCVCVTTRLLPWDGSLLFQNRRDIFNTTLMTRTTAHKPSLTMGV